MEPWFERFPDLLDWELRRFEEWGYEFEREEAQDQLVLRLSVEFQGTSEEVRVFYPSEYPELPPVVYGSPGLLDRHQHPFDGNFCLLERSLDDWPARGWGAADLVGERLRALLEDSEGGPARVREAEAPMPEPSGNFFHHTPGAAVLLPGDLLPLADQGKLFLRQTMAAPNIFLAERVGSRESESPLLELLPSGDLLTVPWQRLDGPPPVGPNGEAVVRWVRENFPDFLANEIPAKLRGNSRIPQPPAQELCGFVFTEEGPGVGEVRDGYLFVAVNRLTGQTQCHLLHTQIVSAEERERRIPELSGLSEKQAIVLGVGTLGAEVALALARAGIGYLDLIDADRFEFGNTVRHPLGFEFSGLGKAEAVRQAAARANPFCEIRAHCLYLGASKWGEGPAPLEQLKDLLDAADVVVDATGSHQISQLLGRLASDAEIAMVSGWMTDGFHGAEVSRFVPGKTCCWTCQAEARKAGKLPRAASGPSQEMFAQGCSHPTTTGAGFDALETAAVISRLTVQSLAPAGSYPDSLWDHAAISFRADDASRPRFASATLPPTKGCASCLATAGATAGP